MERVNELRPTTDGAALELVPAMESHRLPDCPGGAGSVLSIWRPSPLTCG